MSDPESTRPKAGASVKTRPAQILAVAVKPYYAEPPAHQTTVLGCARS